MKGIILAGGSGTRLYPLTQVVSKQLQSIYDKPMIYYPLSTLMLAGMKDILVITTREDSPLFKKQLGDGSRFGINLSYEIQEQPKGLAQAFTIGEEFIGKESCAMILGDNIFYGDDFIKKLQTANELTKEGFATNFGYQVKDPERFGIMELDSSHNIISVEEKPTHPKSKFAITGLYFYPNDVIEKAKLVRPSKRGELEITSINQMYLEEKRLKACLLGGGYDWFDTGTFDAKLEAENFVQGVQKRKGKIIYCPEQIGYDLGYLEQEKLLESANLMIKNDYGKYLEEVSKRPPMLMKKMK